MRHRWHLTLGRSSETLLPLLDKLGQIDVFFHDGEHSYGNMLWEFQNAWTFLRAGGLLLAHNIDFNDAFFDFRRRLNVKGYSLGDMGGIVKA